MAQVYRETHYKHHHLQAAHVGASFIRAVGALVILFLGARFILSLLPVDQLPSFTTFVYSVTYPFVSPFLNLFSSQIQAGSMWIEYQSLIAAAFWAFAAWLLARLLTTSTETE